VLKTGLKKNGHVIGCEYVTYSTGLFLSIFPVGEDDIKQALGVDTHILVKEGLAPPVGDTAIQ
jgi:hypothetical protein